jgi:hypothetical protein
MNHAVSIEAVRTPTPEINKIGYIKTLARRQSWHGGKLLAKSNKFQDAIFRTGSPKLLKYKEPSTAKSA